MEAVIYISLIVLPAGAVIFMAHYLISKSLEKEKKNQDFELKKERQKHWLPLKIDAYQRGLLFLERIHPSSMLMREQHPKYNSNLLHTKILESIRNEYEHNIAQQLYISKNSWDALKKSKEETIKIYNMALQKAGDDVPSLEYSKAVFALVSEIGKLPSEIAVDLLKEEVQAMFN